MKFLLTSDWHIRATRPQYRIDNYSETLLCKLKYIFNLAKEQNCDAILQAGDFFDSPDQSNRMEIEVIQLLLASSCPVFTIFGQHDCRYRNPQYTALEKFRVQKLVHLLTAEPTHFSNVAIYGASFNEEIPKVQSTKTCNILVVHRMVTKDGPLWYDQQNFITSKEMLQKYRDFQIILSGDNHQSFSTIEKDRALYNCGSLMRATIAQLDHTPRVYILDTKAMIVEEYPIPILPISEVMNIELVENVKERNEALDAFMTGLNTNLDVHLNYEENISMLMELNNTDSKVQNIVKDFLKLWYEQRGNV